MKFVSQVGTSKISNKEMKRTRIPWDLIVAKLNNKLSAEEELIFHKWLVLGDNHDLFIQLEAIGTRIQSEILDYEPDVESYWQELSTRINRIEGNIGKENIIQQKTKRFYPNRFYQKFAAAAVLVVIAISSLLYFIFDGDKAVIYTYSSAAEKLKVELPDGTVVWLNSNTKLTFDNSTDPSLRLVSLEGEAYFDVKFNADAPFSVKSGDVSIKVHGTQFNLNSYPSSQKTIVSLYEGSISMNITDVNFYLKPNEEAYFDKATRVVSIKQGDVDFAKSWTQDKIRLENKNIREVCQYLSKLYGISITIDSSVPSNQSYTFTLTNQPLEDILKTMSSITPIDYSFSENEVLITSKK